MSATNINHLSIKQSPLTIAWLKLGIASLIAAGLFSVLLVLSRTPAIQNVIPWIDFFHTALVVHVNLSVLFWFMNFACLFWSIYAQGKMIFAERIALVICLLGTLFIIASAFTGDAKPLINNYIPVLQQGWFFAGLTLFAMGVLIQIVRVLIMVPAFTANSLDAVFKMAAYISALTSLVAGLAFAWSWLKLPADIDGVAYYEFLFWGGGHILQFSHTVLLLFAWLLLSIYSGYKLKTGYSNIGRLFWLLFLPVPVAIWIVLATDVISPEHREYFTLLMKYGGLASLPMGLLIVSGLFSRDANHQHSAAAHSALLSSIVLFATGGIIGFLIHGINVVIPAHYHGSIVGVTLAFMGITYYLLPQFGYKNPEWKMAKIQPWIYGAGQMMHIIGLAWSGGYGVQRKTAGAAQGLDSLPEIAGMALMGLGGLVSIIGGVLFLIVVLRSMWPQRH